MKTVSIRGIRGASLANSARRGQSLVLPTTVYSSRLSSL